MLFQSPQFLLFFVIFAFGLYFIPKKWTKWFTIIASGFFYSAWYYPFILILSILIVYSWIACRIISKRQSLYPLFSIIALLPLIYYKYTGFLLNSVGLDASIAPKGLPLGISFITFTLISMMVDLGKSKKAAASFTDIALYISYFPHLISGPILRSWQLIPQLNSLRISLARFCYNLPLFTIGVIKKVLIADMIAKYIDPIYANPSSYNSTDLLIATFGFSIQLYCDFSAYTDMAIALAGTMGIHFPKNFKSPYLAISLTEYWRRWHITLSFWLRDYVFAPLHYRLRDKLPYTAIFFTMIVSGLWHGANWTFVLWGAVEGVIMMLESYTKYSQKVYESKWLKPFSIVSTFLIICFVNVILRSSSISNAWDQYAGMVSLNFSQISYGGCSVILLGILVLSFHHYDQADRICDSFKKIPKIFSVPILLGLIIGCCFLSASRPQSFYYFDF